jgi:hypothetical protein
MGRRDRAEPRLLPMVRFLARFLPLSSSTHSNSVNNTTSANPPSRAVFATVIEVIGLLDTRPQPTTRSSHFARSWCSTNIMSTVGGHAVAPDKCALPTATPNTAPKDKPFPFLALPKELRLMVYERIPIHISGCQYNYQVDGPAESMELIRPCISVCILATCRQIHAEAADIMSKRFRTLLDTPLRVVVTTKRLFNLHASDGPFQDIPSYTDLVYNAEEQREDPDWYDDWEREATEKELDQVRTKLTRDFGKWFLLFERQRLPSGNGSTTFPDVEIAILHDDDDDDDDEDDKNQLESVWDDPDCLTILSDLAEGWYGAYQDFIHRLVTDHIPVAMHDLENIGWVSEVLPGIGRNIDRFEYENEWRADDDLTFPST